MIYSIVITVIAIVIVVFYYLSKKKESELSREKEIAINEMIFKIDITPSTESDLPDSNNFDKIIDKLICENYEIALKHSKTQNIISLVVAAIGFALIIYISILTVRNGSQWQYYILNNIPGIIIEAISVLFFKQSEETRRQATVFLDKLREDRKNTQERERDDRQNIQIIGIIDSIEDKKMRNQAKAKFALHLSGIKKLDDDYLNNLMSQNKSP